MLSPQKHQQLHIDSRGWYALNYFADTGTVREPVTPISKSEYQLVELAIQAAGTRYGEAAEIEARAWEMWGEGIDAGYTYDVTTDLLKHAQLAEQVRKEAYAELDAAKAMLLSLQS
jgi:hypothetical protein